MADTEALKIEPWAVDGDRGMPARIDRAQGWSLGYEQHGSLLLPEREAWNQLVAELSAWAVGARDSGGIQVWDRRVKYRQWARAISEADGKKYVALVENTGVDPFEDETGTWRIY